MEVQDDGRRREGGGMGRGGPWHKEEDTSPTWNQDGSRRRKSICFAIIYAPHDHQLFMFPSAFLVFSMRTSGTGSDSLSLSLSLSLSPSLSLSHTHFTSVYVLTGSEWS